MRRNGADLSPGDFFPFALCILFVPHFIVLLVASRSHSRIATIKFFVLVCIAFAVAAQGGLALFKTTNLSVLSLSIGVMLTLLSRL